MNDSIFVKKAIEKAVDSFHAGGFPAGAIVVQDGKVIGEGISIGNKLNDPTSHAEMAAIRDACKNISASDLKTAVLYSSMEPCSMCHSAAMWGGIAKIVFACAKAKVSPDYYGGTYLTDTLNKCFNNPLELVHCDEQEGESLKVVKRWEGSFS